MVIDVDALANEIRRVDGSHSLGAGALAEALMPFIERALEPQGQALPVGEVMWLGDTGFCNEAQLHESLPWGTKLYASPSPAVAQPVAFDSMKLLITPGRLKKITGLFEDADQMIGLEQFFEAAYKIIGECMSRADAQTGSGTVAQPVADERVSRDKDQRGEIFVAFRDLASHYTKNRNDIETPQILFAGTKTQAEAHALNAQEAYLDSYPGYREASRKPPCEWKVVAVDSDVSLSSSARQIENDRLIARLFSGAAVPCSTEIDKRGYQWCEAYLDKALNRYRAALYQPAEEGGAQ